jgi:hypothetical protein
MSPVATGHGSFVGHASESVWGTPVAATGYNRIVNETFLSRGDRTNGDRSLGKAFLSGARDYRLRSEGDVTFEWSFQGFERWLFHLFGTGSVTTTPLGGADTGAYKHEFVLKSARNPGMSVEWHLEIMKIIMAGLRLNSLGINMGVGIPELVFGGVAKAFAGPPGSIGSPTYLEDVAGITKLQALESGSPGTPGTASVGYSLRVGTAGTFAGPTTYCAEEPSNISIEAPIDATRTCLGDPNIREPVLSDFFRVSGSFSRELVDDDFLEFFRARNPVYLRQQYDGPGPIIPAGSQHYQAILDVPYARITQAGAQIQGTGALRESVPWEIDPPSQAAADAFKLTIFNKLSTVS